MKLGGKGSPAPRGCLEVANKFTDGDVVNANLGKYKQNNQRKKRQSPLFPKVEVSQVQRRFRWHRRHGRWQAEVEQQGQV